MVVAAIIAALLLLVVWFRSSGVEKVVITGASVERVYRGGATDSGYLSFVFNSTTEGHHIVNAFVDWNGDGAYAPYEVDGKTQEEHVVIDFPASVRPDEAAGYPITIPDNAIDARVAITGTAIFSGAGAASSTPDAPPGDSDVVPFTITSVGKSDMSDFLAPGVNDGKRRGFGALGEAIVGVPVARAETPSAARPPQYVARADGLPDTNQNYNECAPTAVSNNVRWLAKKYKFEDMISGDTRDLINELKGDLAWNDGVADENFIPGKNAFFARHGVPIVTHRIGTKNDPDIHWKIYEEMRRGQAVEIGVSFYETDADGVMHPAGGHTVAVASVYRNEGKNVIGLHDSATRSPEGQPKTEYYEMSGDMIQGYGGTAFIDIAWAQSPTDALAKGNFVDPMRNDENYVLKTGETIVSENPETTRAIGKFGFFYVDIGHPGDHMVGESFPVSATVIKRNTAQEMPYWVMENEKEVRRVFTHRAEDPWTLAANFISFGRAVAPSQVLDVPRNGVVRGDRYRAEATFTCTSPGPATITYSADISWNRAGEVPAELLPRYAEQLRTADVIMAASPTFLCKSATPLPEKEKPRIDPRRESFCPGVDEDPNGTEIDVLKSGSECYPTTLFHQAEVDKCDALHWHANEGHARSLKGNVWVDPNGCGLGKVKSVPAGKVKLSPDQVAPYIR